MKLYLVRHGEATAVEEDPQRPLTDRGKADVTKVASFLGRRGVNVGRIRHSGKKRAEETALIFGEHLSPPAGVGTIQGLAPMDDVVPMAEVMQLETNPVMLVGHLPFLSRLAALLLTGNAEKTVIRVRAGCCICLVNEEDHWSVEWAVTPDLL